MDRCPGSRILSGGLEPVVWGSSRHSLGLADPLSSRTRERFVMCLIGQGRDVALSGSTLVSPRRSPPCGQVAPAVAQPRVAGPGTRQGGPCVPREDPTPIPHHRSLSVFRDISRNLTKTALGGVNAILVDGGQEVHFQKRAEPQRRTTIARDNLRFCNKEETLRFTYE